MKTTEQMINIMNGPIWLEALKLTVVRQHNIKRPNLKQPPSKKARMNLMKLERLQELHDMSR